MITPEWRKETTSLLERGMSGYRISGAITESAAAVVAATLDANLEVAKAQDDRIARLEKLLEDRDQHIKYLESQLKDAQTTGAELFKEKRKVLAENQKLKAQAAKAPPAPAASSMMPPPTGSTGSPARTPMQPPQVTSPRGDSVTKERLTDGLQKLKKKGGLTPFLQDVNSVEMEKLGFGPPMPRAGAFSALPPTLPVLLPIEPTGRYEWVDISPFPGGFEEYIQKTEGALHAWKAADVEGDLQPDPSRSRTAK